MTRIVGTDPVQISKQELELILAALEDAVVYRDARAHVLKSMIRRADRRGNRPAAGGDSSDDHSGRAKAYAALMTSLRRRLTPS